METLLIILGVAILGVIGFYLTRDPDEQDPLTMDEVKDNLDNLGQNVKNDVKEVVVEVKEKLDLNDDGKVDLKDAAVAVVKVKKKVGSNTKRAIQKAKKKKVKAE